MGKRQIVLITGGARSGKSRFALELASFRGKKIFVATATASDEEMRQRIESHRKERSSDWFTIEQPIDVSRVVAENPENLMLIDCLTLWVSNLMMHGRNDEEIQKEVQQLCECLLARRDLTILITNEVGFGIVPDNELARRFRDLSGMMNQLFAAEADAVILMVSGLPMYLKRSEPINAKYS